MTNKLSTLWIGDLEPYMDETFLKTAFTLMGENLLNGKVIRNRYTGTTMGYGFLDFGDEPTSLRVLHRCNGKVIPNANPANAMPQKRFKLNHASYGKENPAVPEFSLFVGDLSEDVDDLALFIAFSGRFPSVKAAKVVLDQNGVSKGYGFIRFFAEEEYNSALIECQNTVFVGSKPIRVSIATPKSRQATAQSPLIDQRTNTIVAAAAAAGVSASSQVAAQAAQAYFQQYPANAAQTTYDYTAYYQAYYAQQQAAAVQQAQQAQQQQQAQQHGYYGYAAAYDQNYAAASYDYAQQMQQYYDTSTYEVPDAQAEAKLAQDNALEEHDSPLDIEQLNADAMARNDDLYSSLDNSRWLPTEGLNPPMIDVKY